MQSNTNDSQPDEIVICDQDNKESDKSSERPESITQNSRNLTQYRKNR